MEYQSAYEGRRVEGGRGKAAGEGDRGTLKGRGGDGEGMFEGRRGG